MKPLIFDVSSYQGLIKFDKLVSDPTPEEQDIFPNGKEIPYAVIVRSGISWGYVDSKFVMNYAGVKSISLRPAIYHVFRPDAAALQQVDAMCRLLDIVKYDGSHIILPDIELHLGYDANHVMDEYFKTYDIITKKGIKQATYSAKWFIDVYMKNTPRFQEPKFMLASYGLDNDGGYREMPTEEFLNGVAPKYISSVPSRIPKQNVLMHQFTDRFHNSSGMLYGMESFGLDASRFIGTQEELSWCFGETIQDPIEDPIEDPTGVKTVNVGNSSLAFRDENMVARAWLKTGCKVNLTGKTRTGIGEDGKVYKYQNVNINGDVAEDYLD